MKVAWKDVALVDAKAGVMADAMVSRLEFAMAALWVDE